MWAKRGIVVQWRLIALEEHDAYSNMAIDESIMTHIKHGLSLPTMRFYRWKPSAVSIGRFQSLRDEVNIERCKELGVDYVRRITGGGAVYHDYLGELTYSILAPESMFPKGIHESYSLICGWIIDGLGKLQIDAQFAPINDITCAGKKISGNAQTRKDGILLQHGTILYDLDVSRMFSVLNVSKEKISDKMIASVHERVTSVRRQKDITFEQLYQAIMDGFIGTRDVVAGPLSQSEAELAAQLSVKYRSDDWNFSR